MSTQDERLKTVIDALASVTAASVAGLVGLPHDAVKTVIKASLLSGLSELGVDTAGIKTESDEVEISIQG